MTQDLGGQKLGQYELRERLGRGGMADVYKAFQPGMERFVAIKVMLGHLATDAEFIERFRREARAVGKLRHPNIVNVFDFGIEREVYYMVMEFIRGENLKAYIGDHPNGLPLDASLRIASQIADALNYAHEAGMIHRDVKPANIIFMDETHQQAILTDFGIAHILSQPGLTATGAMVGTPAYLSPEVASGRDVDERADIYGLGIILYEMLTGRVPYEADTPMAIIMKHVNAPLPSPAEYGRELPEEVEAVILKAMMKNPDDRYQTAAEMKTAIDRAYANITSTDLPVNMTDATERIRVGTTSTVPARRPTESLEDKPTTMITTPPSKPPLLWIGAGIGAVVIVIAALLILSGGGGGQPAPTPTIAELPTEVIAAAATSTEQPTEAATEIPTEIPAAATDVPTEIPTEASTATEAPSATPVPPTATDAPTEVAAVPENVARAREAGLLSGLTSLQDQVDALLMEGNFDAAQQQVNQLLDSDPQNVEALTARSLLSTFDGNGQSAKADAERAIELAPDSPLGYIALSDALDNWSISDDPGALDAALKAADLAPDNPEALWRVSRAQSRLGNQDAARNYFERANVSGAVGYRFADYAGDYLFYQSEYERALPYLTTRLNADESDMYSLRMVAADLLHLDRGADAYATVQRFPGLFTDPGDLSMAAYVAYSEGDFDQARTWSETARALSDDAYASTYLLGLISWYADHDLDSAMSYFDQLEGVDFYDDFLNMDYGHEMHLDRGRILMEAGEYEAALGAFQQAIDAVGEYPFIYEAMADAHLALNQTEAARDNLRQALDATYDNVDDQKRLLDRIRALGAAGQLTPEAPPTPASAENTLLSGLTPLQDQIDSLIANGQIDEARVIVISTLRTDPNNLDALVASTLYFAQTGDRIRALHDADQAIRLNPNSPLGYIARSDVLRNGNQGDLSRALVAVQKALELDPNNPEALWRASDIQGKLGHRQVSLELLGQAEANGAQGFRFLRFAGEMLYNVNEYERAEPYLESWKRAAPDSIDATGFMAANLLQLGRVDDAYRLVRNSVNPRWAEVPEAPGWAAYVAFRANDFDQARTWATMALDKNPDQPNAHYVLGLISWYADHDLKAAMEHLDVPASLPDFGDILLNPDKGHQVDYDRGRILAEAGEMDAAIDAYHRSLERDPRPYTYEALADAYLAKGDPGAALENLQHALERTPDDPQQRDQLMSRIRELENAIASAPPAAPTREELLSGLTPLQDEIDNMILDGQGDEVSARLTQILRDDPNNVDALVARSLYYAMNDRMSFALTDADHALQQAPTSPLAYIARSEALLQGGSGDISRALAAVQKALELDPNNPEALWRASFAQAELGNWDAFLDLLGQAEAAGARGFRFAEFAGQYLYYDTQFERALPYTTRWHAAFPDDIWPTVFLAANLVQVDQVGQAYDLFRNYSGDLDNAEQFAWAAYVAYQAGDVDQARAWAASALEDDDSSPEAHYVLGLISWYVDHNLDEALQHLEVVQKVDGFWDVLLNPDTGHEVFYDRGRILAESGDLEGAIDAYNQSLDIDARPYTYEALADAYIALGDVDTARENLQNALDMTEDPTQQAHFTERLQQLGN